MLWLWFRQTRAAGKKWEKMDQRLAFMPRTDQGGYVRRKKKATY